MNDATITPSDNGPYIIKGEVTLLDVEGNPYRVNGAVALCRCGHSYTKPFCDGSHEVTNFTAADRAADEASSDGFSNRHLHCLAGPPPLTRSSRRSEALGSWNAWRRPSAPGSSGSGGEPVETWRFAERR